MGRRHQAQFQPTGELGEFESDTSVLDAAQVLGVNIRSDCGGKGTCGKCRVVLVDGGGGLEGPTQIERKILGGKLDSGYRLACQTLLTAPLELSVPEESRIEKAIALIGAEVRPVELDPMVKKYHLEIEAPTLAEPLGDVERLLATLEQTYGLKGVTVAYPVLRQLPRILRDAAWDVTVTVWDWGKPVIIAVAPGYSDEIYGIAVDIGTTTLVGYLLDLTTGQVVATESMLNPQVAFGGDILSRISYAIEKEHGRRQLCDAVRQGLNQIVQQACAKAEVGTEQVAEMTVVGNTAMHHLFLDIETEFVAKTPFPPAIHGHCDLKAQDLQLILNPATNVHVLPIEAGFVGADHVAAVIATELYDEEAVTLLIDIGTNGELVLGNSEYGLLACSVAAGPAFEGACIKFGMRAAAGAIERVRIDPFTFEVECQVIGGVPPRGICGSGIIDAVMQMSRTGVVLPDGRFNAGIPSARMRRAEKGYEFVLEWGANSGFGQDLVISQQDVREIQLAKGAFHAGIHVLKQHLGVEQIEKVLLAGAFGSYIDPESAMGIGLFPECDLGSVAAVGNAAGHGACIALLSRRERAKAIKIARQIRYVELTADPNFHKYFIEGTLFPDPHQLLLEWHPEK
ncbi:MAG TPA: ferredoxin [Chloroflexi bacterium]|nr:ferredoxin [Chloroflexota bacterium]